MFGRIILAAFFIASIAWISYVGFDILNVKSNFSPETLFSEHDSKILIVNRPNEINFNQLNDFSDAPTLEFFQSLNCNNCIAFISSKQSHLLLKNALNNWDDESIKSLFSSLQDFKLSGDSFTVGEYEGKYFKSSLYLSKGNIKKKSHVEIEYIYDKKASASIVEIGEGSKIKTIEDIYFLPDGKVNYIMRNDSIQQGKQIKDQLLFSKVLTSKFSSYHFFERDYYAIKDSIFENNPMFKWTLNGFIDFDYKGQRAIISDYIEGQDPILILNDIHQSLDKHVFSDQLLLDFPKKGNPFCIKYLEDFVIMSESESTCNQIIADFMLGNTIALNSYVRNKLFGQLPQSVSERFISENTSYTKAVYQGKILQTRYGTLAKVKTVEEQETVSMNCEFDIHFLVANKGVGNVIAQGVKGELALFCQGELKWQKKIESKIVGDIQVVDLYNNGELFTLFNTENEVYLINEKGEFSSGFPIRLDDEITNQVKFYRWKGKSYLLVATEEKNVIQLDGEGRELNIFKSQQSVIKKIDVWVSQNKLFAGFSNASFFEMYNIEKNSSHRTFKLPEITITAKIPNELIQFGIEDNQLIKLDQKGVKHQLKTFTNAKLLEVVNENKNPVVLVKSANNVHFLNNEGIPFGMITLPFNEIDDIVLLNSNSGKTTIAVVDGLENNVYLYHTNGELITKKPLEGQRMVQLQNIGASIQVTTIVDQFIVQYFN